MLEVMEDPFGTITIDAITQFESRRNLSLPDEYKRFLLTSNGGRPVPDAFDVPGWAHENSGMQAFFGVQTGNSYDLERELDVYDDRIPRDLLPIGCDSFGNIICLGIEGKRRGKIYFWDHEDELDENGLHRQDYSNVFLVANSFGEFLDKLTTFDD
ncbi:MAG: SMI1/KNR4 family protein [Polyangiaceae bacterium]|nr:SMI1/KNR4 family protein [Polyangiaceae bacterium]